MPKYAINIDQISTDAFAEKYSHLVRTITKLDQRAIATSIRLGWKIPEIVILKGESEEEEEENVTTDNAVENNTTTAPKTGLLLPAGAVPQVPATFERLPNENDRSFHQRFKIHQQNEESRLRS